MGETIVSFWTLQDRIADLQKELLANEEKYEETWKYLGNHFGSSVSWVLSKDRDLALGDYLSLYIKKRWKTYEKGCRASLVHSYEFVICHMHFANACPHMPSGVEWQVWENGAQSRGSSCKKEAVPWISLAKRPWSPSINFAGLLEWRAYIRASCMLIVMCSCHCKVAEAVGWGD